jgi:hypothetical protein
VTAVLIDQTGPCARGREELAARAARALFFYPLGALNRQHKKQIKKNTKTCEHENKRTKQKTNTKTCEHENIRTKIKKQNNKKTQKNKNMRA